LLSREEFLGAIATSIITNEWLDDCSYFEPTGQLTMSLEKSYLPDYPDEVTRWVEWFKERWMRFNYYIFKDDLAVLKELYFTDITECQRSNILKIIAYGNKFEK